MIPDNLQAKFNKQMDDLWAAYLKHCEETGITPATRKQFSEAVYREVVRKSDVQSNQP